MHNTDPSKEQIVREARRLAADVEKYAGENINEMGKRGQELWEQARESARERWQRAQQQSREKGRQVDQFVHENVWTSIGIAAAVGAVVGLMMKMGRRRRD